MSSFNPNDYGPVLSELVDIDRQRPLDSGNPSQAAKAKLRTATLDSAFAHTEIADAEMARCVLSGVWLLHDFLDESHTFSQAIHTSEGSFWHGIMHRREGDFSNAKYWFRNAGDHPAYSLIAARVANEVEGGESLLSGTDWEPFDFVDACQAALRTGEQATACLHAQQIEWEVLFDHCYQAAL
ncbi:MAG: hypothetical protein RH917_18760 [Lacipirellulaceae bacterium]